MASVLDLVQTLVVFIMTLAIFNVFLKSPADGVKRSHETDCVRFWKKSKHLALTVTKKLANRTQVCPKCTESKENLASFYLKNIF